MHEWGNGPWCTVRLLRPFRLCAEAPRKGKEGSQPPGGVGRANSTPGSLWLDSKAEIVAGEEHRLSDHSGPVLYLALSGSRLYSSSTDFSIKARAAGCVVCRGLFCSDMHSAQPAAGREAHQLLLSCVLLMQVWDVAGGQCVATLAGDNKPVQSLWIAEGRLYSAAGHYLRVWDVDAPSFPCVRVLQLPRHGGAICALALDAAGIVYVAGQVQQCLYPACSALNDLHDACYALILQLATPYVICRHQSAWLDPIHKMQHE